MAYTSHGSEVYVYVSHWDTIRIRNLPSNCSLRYYIRTSLYRSGSSSMCTRLLLFQACLVDDMSNSILG